ncbi:MAG: hypothetical protein LBT51_00580 [Fusobacteriaceae bacterium]|jgi:hypothetical protein|nr:hypothetical protein [Fusobacteriaceae bacterium]
MGIVSDINKCNTEPAHLDEPVLQLKYINSIHTKKDKSIINTDYATKNSFAISVNMPKSKAELTHDDFIQCIMTGILVDPFHSSALIMLRNYGYETTAFANDYEFFTPTKLIIYELLGCKSDNTVRKIIEIFKNTTYNDFRAGLNNNAIQNYYRSLNRWYPLKEIECNREMKKLVKKHGTVSEIHNICGGWYVAPVELSYMWDEYDEMKPLFDDLMKHINLVEFTHSYKNSYKLKGLFGAIFTLN